MPVHPIARPRRRGWLLPVALGLLLRSPELAAAAFLPGPAEADPPTGDNGPPAAPAQPAAEPLVAGSGIRWALAPWRTRGSVTLDGRWLRTEDGRRALQGVASGDIEFASYVWQPWFIQVRSGVGLLLVHSRDGGDGTATGQGSQGSAALTGRVQVAVFPASRFPFELRADASDSRSSGDTLLNDYRTLRLALSQAWRPATGSDSVTLNLDHSRVRGTDGASDTLSTLRASGLRQWEDHAIDLGLDLSRNTRTDSDNRSRQVFVSAHHSFQPASAFSAETIATWNTLRLNLADAGARQDIGSDVLQLSTFASWRPRAGDWLHSESAPLTLAGTARFSEASTVSSDSGTQRVQAFNLSGGIGKEFSRQWRASASASLSRLQGRHTEASDALALNTALVFTPDSLALGEWRYAPSLSASGGINEASGSAQRRIVGLQGSHSLSRNWVLDSAQALSLNLSQSAGVLRESASASDSRGLAHSIGLFWQASGEGSSQRFASLSFSDSRTASQGSGNFQFANLQLSQRTQLSRFQSWSANLTAQASRSSAEQVDAFTGAMLTQQTGWQRFYTGVLSYEAQRVFGVPGLRFTGLLNVNSQQLERRAAGDIDAPLERITESAEARLDYAIGRLDTRLSARAARVDGRSVAAIVARAQRRF